MATGLQRLAEGEGPALRGVPTALLCHPASVTTTLEPAEAVLRRAGAKLVALLGPEHGIDAAAQDMIAVADASDPTSADDPVPVHNLYGSTVESLSPTPAMFHGAEVLVCDLQDIGSRYYTYAWTAVMAAEVALGLGMRVWVLDRPNPLGGVAEAVEGGTIAPGFESFVGYHPVAVRHGLTLGELVVMALSERARVDARRLEVIACVGWSRAALGVATGLPWVLPSPNMPTLETALVYPGQCLFEGTRLSEGRGTTRPFEIFGAPWVEGRALAAAIRPEDAPGLRLRPLRFSPTFHKHAGRSCGGLQLHVVDPEAVRSLRTAWALLIALRRLGGTDFAYRTEPYEFVADPPAIDLLAGGAWLRAAIEAGLEPAELVRAQEDERRTFLRRREPFLLYR